MRMLLFLALLFPALVFPQELYEKHCAACHGANRLGGMGPALLPENLSRLRQPAAAKVIRDSRPGVQMPAFGQTLNDAEIATASTSSRQSVPSGSVAVALNVT